MLSTAKDLIYVLEAESIPGSLVDIDISSDGNSLSARFNNGFSNPNRKRGSSPGERLLAEIDETIGSLTTPITIELEVHEPEFSLRVVYGTLSGDTDEIDASLNVIRAVLEIARAVESELEASEGENVS